MTVREKPVPCRYERVFILIKKTTFIFSSVFVISFIGLVKNNTNLSTETQYQLRDFPLYSNLDPELFCACRGEGSRALGNPGARFVSDWFQQKTIKVFLIGLFKFARERLNVRRVWRVSGFFP